MTDENIVIPPNAPSCPACGRVIMSGEWERGSCYCGHQFKKQSDSAAGSTIDVGEKVTVIGDYKTGEQGYVKELLSPKEEGTEPDDLWVVVLKAEDGSMNEEHFYTQNLQSGWSNDQADAPQ